jgi:hypothetical protein
MAKRKKLQDQNPPRRVEIRGQDHLLAYITPEEARMLMANGGTGEAGPMGIPAYAEDDGDEDGSSGAGAGGGSDSDDAGGGAGGGTGDGDTSGDMGGGWNDGLADAIADTFGAGPSAAQQTMDRATEKDYGTPDPTSQDIEAGRGFDFGSPASKAMEQSFASGFNQLGGYSVSGLELDKAFGQLDARMANAKAGYGLPGLFGGLLGKIGMTNLENIKSGLQKGHMPAFDKAGQIQGVFGPDPFGFGGLVYSGNPIEGNEATGWSDPTAGGDGYDDRPEVAPVNPATGQCDAGYMFDEDLQACRLDTGGLVGGGVTGDTFVPGAYARMGLLDVAPTGLPEFSEQYGIPSQDFDAANLAFRRGTATQAGIFQDPYDLTGYTLLG